MCRTADDDQSLEKEARKWATRIARETRAVQDNLRQLQLLQAAGGGGGKVDSKVSWRSRWRSRRRSAAFQAPHVRR